MGATRREERQKKENMGWVDLVRCLVINICDTYKFNSFDYQTSLLADVR